MPTDHYENFPVASLILPNHLRISIQKIYNFARSADDIADCPDLPFSFKCARLQFYREELRKIETNSFPLTTLFHELSDVINQYNLPIKLFEDLLDAFEQDLTVTRYETYAQLTSYCERSANPIGRILLHLFEQPKDEYFHLSDSVCTGLQIINFLQDITEDYDINRIYLPSDEMKSFGVTEEHIKHQIFDLKWLNFMGFQVDRAQQLLNAGAPLYDQLPGRIGIEIKAIVKSGIQVTKKLMDSRGNIFYGTHKLTVRDLFQIMFQIAFSK